MNDAGKFSRITEVFYVVKGNVEMVIGKKGKINFNKGDLALVTTTEKENNLKLKIYSSSQEESKIIRASIFLTNEIILKEKLKKQIF